MIEKLENLFQSSITTEFNPKDSSKLWFKTDTNLIFGLAKSSVSDIEMNLIKSLFTPIETNGQTDSFSEQQEVWFHYLFNHSAINTLPTLHSSVQFFYFYLDQPIDDFNNFKLALSGHFHEPVLLMIHPTHFIIVETNPERLFDQVQFDQLNKTLTSDFFVKIYSYIGQLHTAELTLKDYFQAEYNLFQVINQQSHHNKSVLFYDALPIALIHSPAIIKKNIFSKRLNDSLKNTETLHTIQTFLNSNLNSSLTAKNLYIHRNSLQYRLDKFVENTGIDIRSFNNASFISLVILLLKNESF